LFDPQTTPAGVRRTLTDEQGWFVFSDVEAGSYLLTATGENHLSGFVNVDVPPIALLPETTLVDIDLVPTGSVAGHALLENATQHENTIVYVEGTSYLAVTDASGAYVITGVPLGVHTVRGTHPGYLDDTTSAAVSAAGDSVTADSLFLALDSNIPPTATIGQIPTQPVQHVYAPVTLNGTGSDPDGTVVLYEWDFEDDGTFDWSSPTAGFTSHLYSSPGLHRAKLRVTDDKGAIGLAAIEIDVLDAIYVSAGSGNDANPGTQGQPLQTIQAGIDLSVNMDYRPVAVAVGGYSEFTAVSLISVYGGLSDVTWQRLGGQ
jgi:PKD repeat protein